MEKDSKYHHLPSYVYYDKLNDDIVEDDENAYWNSIESSFEETPWIRDVFFKLERNLTEINESRAEDNLSKKHCYDLNYWLYEQVYANLNNNENDENFYKIIDGLQDAWSDINKDKFPNENNLCYPDKTLTDMHYLKDVKHLFDFIEDFSTIKSEAIKDTNSACYKYIDHLKEKVPLYYEWSGICTMEEENICTKYIDEYPKYNPKNVLQNLSVASLAFSSIFNECYQNIINLFSEAEKIPPRTELKHRNITGQPDSSIVKVGGRVLAESGSDTSQPGNMLIGINALATSVFTVLKQFNSYVLRMVAPLSVSLLSLFLFIYVLYKFTPIGKSILYTHGRIKSKLSQNTNDDKNDDDDDDGDDDDDDDDDDDGDDDDDDDSSMKSSSESLDSLKSLS
ncbi:variable surface protein [Plasmodium gonderi]|uniref:Variable surface protein n=1 Tax=Plasmodium gonderi TaxID=77519 RepID=A0A1Y1JLB7_PLAGO|nr:variable surface protein [Plasmodium gonderi]GAW82007.1 variable surface protein [Plasmodium gonderi]